MAWVEDPPSRTRHLIGNLEAAPLASGEVGAETAFLAYRSDPETDYHLLSGCREDALRKVNGAWKVARRTIVLHANVLLDKTSASSSMGQNLFSVMPLTAKRRSRKSITTAAPYLPFAIPVGGCDCWSMS